MGHCLLFMGAMIFHINTMEQNKIQVFMRTNKPNTEQK